MSDKLPSWDEMSDLDKGAALLHLHKRSWEGSEYAESDYPCRYSDHPALTRLSPLEASRHAASLGDSEHFYYLLGEEEHERLYNLALKEDRKRLTTNE